MQPVVNAAEMRAAEEEAAARGLSSGALMQLAGQGMARIILEQDGAASSRYLALVGPGNNGGDALVVAGLLSRAGATVRVATFNRAAGARPDPPVPGGAPALPRYELSQDPARERLRQDLLACDAVIDGLLGTGRSRPLDDDLQSVLRAVREAPNRPRVIALDLPTGVDADTGAADEATLDAHLTLTLGYMKRGLCLYPARARCGELRVVDIGLPDSPAVAVGAWAPRPRDVAMLLPHRSPTAQKYSAGAVLALAGSPRYVGAPVLACSAAMRAGAGYVTLATTDDALPWIAAHLVETTFAPLPSHGDEGPGPDALARLQELAGRYGALLVGPGLGRAERVTRLVQDALGGALQGPRAAIVDADALYALSTIRDWPAGVKLPLVLTPHTGELARLTGLETQQIEADRFGVAARFAREWGQVLVLKGGPTIVADPRGALSVNTTGNALLATAGTGDVLSGVIAALLAGGVDPWDAARAGVFVHGRAADLAAQQCGDRGMVAGDLIALLPQAIKDILAHGGAAL
jgi:NAD(P)H-hydrate epimerase